ncbi:hypothetical protein [Psychromonas sp. KJ10-2]|uniref:hypothetical protein n=1 Tax=Psychromonas sp. KJ10-2 TaxID=3391822 RepID=UPI0039B54FEC
MNLAILFQGIVEEKSEISSLLAKGALPDIISANAVGYFTSPILSNHLIVGLCWLIFYFFPKHRAAMVAQKAAFAFCDTLQTFIVTNTRGCRAPPQV